MKKIIYVQGISQKGNSIYKRGKALHYSTSQLDQGKIPTRNTGRHPKSTSKMAVFRIATEHLEESGDETNTS